MDSALSVAVTTTQVGLLKALDRRFTVAPPCLHKSLLRRTLKCVASYNYRRIPSSNSFASSPAISPSIWTFSSLLPRTRGRSRCISSSAASFASSGDGNGGPEGGGGGGGGSGGESGDADPKLVAEGAQELLALTPDVIILDVRGMVCGGCAANVKRILESRPQVSSASVNLTTETAIVWPVSEVKTAPNWQKQLGEALAEHLTNCGFNSSLRDSARYSFLQIFERWQKSVNT